MDLIEAIFKRRSIRKFQNIPVEQDKVVVILEAGRQAPTAGNIQEWKFIVVTDPDKIAEIAEACMKQYWIQTAPLVIVIVANHEKSIQHYGERGMMYVTMDCAAAAENMILAATSVGLSSCWVSALDEPMLKTALRIPERGTPLIVLPIGYADEEVPVPFKTPLESLVFLERYANRVRSPELVKWDISLAMEKVVKRNVENIKRTSKRIGTRLFEKFRDLKKRSQEDIDEEQKR